MYDEFFARYYDNLLRDAFTLATLRRALEQLATLDVTAPGPLLDLGCGTGLVCATLATHGWDVRGIDSAAPMLEVARAKAELAGVDVPLEVGDVRDFEVAAPLPAILCTGATLNHLLDADDVKRALAAIHGALRPGGVLVFDLGTSEAYRSALWNFEAIENEVADQPLRVIESAKYDADAGRARVDLEVRDADGNTTHRAVWQEQHYPAADVRAWAEEAGFEIAATEPFHPLDLSQIAPGLEAVRTLWFCRRPA